MPTTHGRWYQFPCKLFQKAVKELRMANQLFVPVPVPEDLVDEVFEFIVERRRASARVEASTTAAPDEWSPADLTDFFMRSSENPRAILEVLARNPDARLTTADLARAIGKGDEPRGTWSVAGVLSAIKKKAKRTYGRDWPFACSYDHGSETYYYTMPAGYASVVSAAAETLEAAISAARSARANHTTAEQHHPV
jgi:AcrR family transcriptional regulator